ncbi:MAG: hypothetical protein PHF56_15870 [Desulfuromonadaceae bacterium]|nr:hypothetical protein [Desulfuromonadaceae bacterium]
MVDTESLSDEITTVSPPYANGAGIEIGALMVLAPTYRMPPHRISSEIIPVLRDITQYKQVKLHDSLQERILELS